jgi:plastocyanin
VQQFRRFAVLLAVAVLLAGCGTAAAAGPLRTDKVSLPPSYRFDPPVIQVAPGTTVTWSNGDNFTHTVQVQGGEVHRMEPGQSASITFDTPGEYPYLCTLHPQNMKGTVIVAAN